MTQAAIDHPIRGRLNALILRALDDYMDRKYAGIKSPILSAAPLAVVELGPGAGANLRYLRRGTRLTAIEPNVRFHPMLRQRASERGIELDLRTLAGEAIDLPSESVDFVFSSLVLCSVRDPVQVLSEVKRVLKPGGRYACVEHVAAPRGSREDALQRAIRRPWRYLFEGCDLCRDLGGSVERAGFSQAAVRRFVLPTGFAPIRHQIVAECVK